MGPALFLVQIMPCVLDYGFWYFHHCPGIRNGLIVTIFLILGLVCTLYVDKQRRTTFRLKFFVGDGSCQLILPRVICPL